MDALELYGKLCRYYGEPAEEVAAAIAEEVERLNHTAFPQIFQTITRSRPAKFGPVDVKDICDAAAALRVAGVDVDKPNVVRCSVCGTEALGSRWSCPTCGFDLAENKIQSKVREHTAWWNEYKAGRAPRFSVDKLISELAKKASGVSTINAGLTQSSIFRDNHEETSICAP